MKIILLFTILMNIVTCSYAMSEKLISQEEAVRISKIDAIANRYNPDNKEIEILKVKLGTERGPIRLSWIIRRLSSKDDIKMILHREFWIIYFYPKGALDSHENIGALGEGFCSLVDMHTGNVIFSFTDM